MRRPLAARGLPAEKGVASVSGQDIVCSFCDKGVPDVECMVTGNGVAGICAACIELAMRIVQQRRGSTGVDILASPGRKRRALARQSTRPTEHQVVVLGVLLAGGYIAEDTPAGKRGWHLVDWEGITRRDPVRSTTVGRLMDERWIERPDHGGDRYRWSITAAGRLALARHRAGDFGLVVLKGGATSTPTTP